MVNILGDEKGYLHSPSGKLSRLHFVSFFLLLSYNYNLSALECFTVGANKIVLLLAFNKIIEFNLECLGILRVIIF